MALKEKLKLPKFVRSYIPRLGIKWPVKCFLVESSQDIAIGTSIADRKHTILVNGKNYSAGTIDKSCWFHELCHASLAENVDISFATILLSAKSKSSLFKDAEGFAQGKTLFMDIGDSQSEEGPLADLLDLKDWSIGFWVEELGMIFNKGVEYQRIATLVQCFFGQKNVQQFVTSRIKRRLVITAAIFFALASRWKIDHESVDLVKLFDSNELDILKELIHHKEKLPQLSYNKNSDLRLVESEMCYISSIFDMKIKPRFRKEGGETVWDIC